MTDPEHIRLLVCKDCKTIEPLPDYHGDPEHDTMLSYLVKRHRFPDGSEHIGMLARIERSDWDNDRIRGEIARRLTAEFGGETGLGKEFYDTRDTFREDAMTCFNEHHRNPDCNDYRADFKRLTPGTAQARREAGLPEYRTSHDRYLCDYCPVQSVVEQAKFQHGNDRKSQPS